MTEVGCCRLALEYQAYVTHKLLDGISQLGYDSSNQVTMSCHQ
jgi:hypothetical protein